MSEMIDTNNQSLLQVESCVDKIDGPPITQRTLRLETLMDQITAEVFTKLSDSETIGGNDE